MLRGGDFDSNCFLLNRNIQCMIYEVEVVQITCCRFNLRIGFKYIYKWKILAEKN